MSDKKIINLSSPVKFGEETISVLEMRQPKGRDFRELKNLDRPFSMMLDMAAALSELPASVMDDLSAEDVQQVTEAVSGFLSGFPGTGKMS